MQDIARAAGVSSMTVSRAIKAPHTVAPSTLALIQKAIKQFGYIPDSLAGGLASKRSGFVSLLVPSVNNVHFAQTAAALKEVLLPAGIQVLLGITQYQAKTEEHLVQTMLQRRPEAIVLTNDGHSARTRTLLAQANVPVIDTWETPATLISRVGHSVGFSSKQAAALMVRHLIDQGYTKIGYLGEVRSPGSRGTKRRDGFIHAMTAAGLDPSRQIAIAQPPVGFLEGRYAFDQLIAQWPDTEAVMCVSDPCAFGALTSCQLRGWPVPDRMAIAGFGGFEISACAVPSLSTINVSGLAIGKSAGELILQLLTALPSSKTSQRKILIATELIARDSTQKRH
jgi:LacI family transcriptional regulator, gluconate utilization system Gnt-I transcriptional repressor